MNEVSRQEKKYAVNLWDSVALRGRLDAVMHGDAHNGAKGYVIRSLYFDTPDDEDFSGKIDGLELRRKIRLRAYSPQSGFAMLEMKQKQGPYQRKRSLRVTREEALRLCQGDYTPLQSYEDPFAAECYGLMHCRGYRPKTIVEYRRQAYVARENHIRITLDSSITATEAAAISVEGSVTAACALNVTGAPAAESAGVSAGEGFSLSENSENSIVVAAAA